MTPLKLTPRHVTEIRGIVDRCVEQVLKQHRDLLLNRDKRWWFVEAITEEIQREVERPQ